MTILTVGDSFTVNRYEGDKPWPIVLGELLNKKVINASREGASNDCIYRRFVYSYSTVPDISLVVIGLTNWDRTPIGYKFYTGFESKTDYLKITRPGERGDLADRILYHYSPFWHVDRTLVNIISIINLCELKNIPVFFFQPIMPFHDRSDVYIKNSELNTDTRLSHYINTHLLFKDIWENHHDKILGLTWSGENITKRNICPDNTWIWFCGKGYHKNGRPELHMGFHNKKLYDNEKHNDPAIYDAHPNLKGHVAIANFLYEKIKEQEHESINT